MKDFNNTLILIDGNSLVNRAFYALPPFMSSVGVPTQAVYGFATMLLRAISDYKPQFMAVAFDLPQPTHRHLKYTAYKATRKKMPDDLRVQMPILKEMLTHMGIAILEKGGFEADDILGTMAQRATHSTIDKTLIITGDRDAFQLINKKTSVVFTKRGISEIIEYTPETLFAHTQLLPHQIIEYKALCGDTSDNIPGVAGVGDKTAINLITAHGTLDNVYQHIDTINGKLKERLVDNKDNAYLSKELATIDTAVPIECNPLDCTYQYPFSADVKRFFIDNNFKSLIKREDIFNNSTIAAGASVQHVAPSKITHISTLDELTAVLATLADNKNLSLALHIAESVHFAYSVEEECVTSITHSLIDPGLDVTQVLSTLKPLLENASVTKVVLDAKATKKFLLGHNIKLCSYFDIKLAQYLVDMSVPYDTLNNLLEAYNIDTQTPATGLLYVRKQLQEQLNVLNLHALYHEIELPLVDILFRMEREGFRINKEKLQTLGGEFSARVDTLSAEIQALAGQTFNVNSPKQLGKILFEDMGLPYPKKDKKFSTAAEVLEQLEDTHPIIKKILSYRMLTKLTGTYVEGLLKATGESGIVRTEFKQTLTTTGRLSSVEPNLQNIPVQSEEGRSLRQAFVSKAKDRVLISADYSQIELRLMAHFSSDPIMLNAYNKAEDIHTQTASEVFGVATGQVTPQMRRDAKAVNFGIIYGISDFGLAKNLGINRYKAKEYIAQYFARFSHVKEYLDTSVGLAQKKGFAETLFGRVRAIPELNSSNPHLRGFGERVAMNMPLQGTAADIIKIAMIKVDKALQGLDAKLILQVHDELIVDAHVDCVERVVGLIQNAMKSAAKLKVPLEVDIGVGETWYDCK